ncbi:hypothetical protein [Sunxiuqinia dokdonensis]|uniref:Transposase IS200-like domain-containing protein n=1 Tax=Sunxiuqinia dokdonensis TaxID=1409788 RepID=A0A0L8V6N3_9BACT|nr:hypothetical protein [Sunxiuqinia dokdonensis]KOH44101.1 hypothetical protein NC99_30940 [Sunxiuqinia dokdonensis]
MPNHFHAIVIIGENDYRVSTSGKPANKFGPQSKNLASIIRGFKSAVTMGARKIDSEFAWPSRFHNHIIRHPKSFQRISNDPPAAGPTRPTGRTID